ncbi:MAG: DUF4445 domain-containing protein [Agathobacter sp.]|nr:DUF4445 domain-containing protein [Agathobacter sp.]
MKNRQTTLSDINPRVKVLTEEGTFEFIMKEEVSLLNCLLQAGRDVIAPCGGTGRCGKCKVQIVEGMLPITNQDKEFFSKEELDCGWRLACGAVVTEDLTIRLGWKEEKDIQVQSEFIAYTEKPYAQIGYGIAIDLGTTTLAAQLVDLSSGQILGTQTGLNHQRAFGADVISRILSATQGKASAMKNSIRNDLYHLIEQLCDGNQVEITQLTKIVIAGNTTMIHLLMGYPCESLGQAPFTTYEIGTLKLMAKELFQDERLQAKVWIAPGISAFVGGDITAGLTALKMDESKDIRLFVDLGTNGEIALGNKDNLLVASTAAGPAFEGGNISCGIGSIPGAICSAEFENDRLVVRTIYNKMPTGICGTGVIELVAAFVKRNVIDETGLLDAVWFEDGYPVAIGENGEPIVLTQEDIREIQLAKAAVRGGIETLLYRYGITAKEVDKVYIAGGFGYALDFKKAVSLGMFPEEFLGKEQAVGNSSLGGAVKILLDLDAISKTERIAKFAKEVDLASDEFFQNAYINAMYF